MAENPAPPPHGAVYAYPVINQGVEVLASAARTDSTVTSVDQTNERWRGVRLILDITAKSGTNPTLDVKVQGKDPVSGNYYDIPGAAFAEQSTVTTVELVIYPGVAETANVSVSDVLPEVWRVHATTGGTDTPTFTYSVGASLTG